MRERSIKVIYVRFVEFIKGCDSYFELRFSKFKRCYKWHNYPTLINMYNDRA